MRPLLVLPFVLGCAQSGNSGPLSRLSRAWAVQTADSASMSVTSTALLGALSAALCVHRADDELLLLGPGDLLPLEPSLQEALGSPQIEQLEVEYALTIVLSGVDVLDRTDQWLRISSVEDGSQFTVELDALIDDGSDNIQVERLVSFGQLRLDLDGNCTARQTLIRGKALWIDEDSRRHDVQIPADSELGGDLAMGGDVPYLPTSGALGWSARYEGQDRSVTTEDAGEIRVDTPDDPVPAARWPVVARGPGWSGTAFTSVAP